jgi:hypothetical protein
VTIDASTIISPLASSSGCPRSVEIHIAAQPKGGVLKYCNCKEYSTYYYYYLIHLFIDKIPFFGSIMLGIVIDQIPFCVLVKPYLYYEN